MLIGNEPAYIHSHRFFRRGISHPFGFVGIDDLVGLIQETVGKGLIGFKIGVLYLAESVDHTAYTHKILGSGNAFGNADHLWNKLLQIFHNIALLIPGKQQDKAVNSLIRQIVSRIRRIDKLCHLRSEGVSRLRKSVGLLTLNSEVHPGYAIISGRKVHAQFLRLIEYLGHGHGI